MGVVCEMERGVEGVNEKGEKEERKERKRKKERKTEHEHHHHARHNITLFRKYQHVQQQNRHEESRTNSGIKFFKILIYLVK